MAIGERARRVHSLDMEKLVYISVSQVLFASFVVSLLFLNVANYLGYDVSTKVILSIWSLLLLLASYLLYRRVRDHVDFLDYLASFVLFHRIRNRDKVLDATNTLLFFGILLVTVSPFIYTFLSVKGYDPTLSVLVLFIGGVLLATAVSGYVLVAEGEA